MQALHIDHIQDFLSLSQLPLQEIERYMILDRLKKKRFNRTHTAKDLGIGIRTLQRKLKLYEEQNQGLENAATSNS